MGKGISQSVGASGRALTSAMKYDGATAMASESGR